MLSNAEAYSLTLARQPIRMPSGTPRITASKKEAVARAVLYQMCR